LGEPFLQLCHTKIRGRRVNVAVRQQQFMPHRPFGHVELDRHILVSGSFHPERRNIARRRGARSPNARSTAASSDRASSVRNASGASSGISISRSISAEDRWRASERVLFFAMLSAVTRI